MKILKLIVLESSNTIFGLIHNFNKIKNYQLFKKFVPLRKYEKIFFLIEKIKINYSNITWKNTPFYFSKTSGTTFKSKYIPVTKEFIIEQINSTKYTLLNYIYLTGNLNFLKGKMIFLSGNSKLKLFGNILTGRLSGIVNYHIPFYFFNSFPRYITNCIENWYNKISKILNETIRFNITFISGIPPWIQTYLDKIYFRNFQNIINIFSNLSLLIYGGVNFNSYYKNIFKKIGKYIDTIELYVASEGFIAFQNIQSKKSLLLKLNNGIFFEFIILKKYLNNIFERVCIKNVITKTNYIIILNTNSGLWGYILGDIVKFLSINPHKIIITGRIGQFISTFGEHVISDEIEKSIYYALNKHKEVLISDFTVAPYIGVNQNLSCHEWLIEFISFPKNLFFFSNTIEYSLRKINSYYNELIYGKILNNLKITCLKKNSFKIYMSSKKKLGGQNKVFKISNNRKIADELLFYNYFF